MEPVEVAGVAPVEAPPNNVGFAASPPVFPALPKPKLGVEDAPAVAPPPKRPDPPELAPPPPNNPEVLDPVVVGVPNKDGDELPVVFPAPPNSPPAGFDVPELALLAPGCGNVKLDMVVLEGPTAEDVGWSMLVVVVGNCLLRSKLVWRSVIGAKSVSRQKDNANLSAES